MATYKTPGVYVEEISTLPPSVAPVSTAIPAFIGYTEKGGGTTAHINTLLEYESLFGKANPSNFSVSADANAALNITRDKLNNDPDFLLYYALGMYFRNGGGSCYVISTGNYPATITKNDFEQGLERLSIEDEPTLIVLVDAVNLSSADYYDLCQQALSQCKKLGDRFLIVDVPNADVALFRGMIGTDNLMYGAAYHPYLQTTLNYQYSGDGIKVSKNLLQQPGFVWQGNSTGKNGITVTYKSANKQDTPTVTISVDTTVQAVDFVLKATDLTIKIPSGTSPTGADIATSWSNKNPSGSFEISKNGDGTTTVGASETISLQLQPAQAVDSTVTLTSLQTTQTELYNQIKAAMNEQRVVLPPSAAIAGIYARIDRDRGVWKAPANVSINSVIGPVSKITHEAQEGLNVDPNAGKSINAIRDFTGKGTLVWGARTLAGNDNEWRYISVRRLFNTIEESTRKASAFAVFEPNDATTWLKVKAMVESYLYGLWEQGALAGAKPESAYFVNVGLGKTMTAQDILEGRMIVEIGIAAVRPAEFIILRFTHKLQEA
jgi:phage tail sheath protein FI